MIAFVIFAVDDNSKEKESCKKIRTELNETMLKIIKEK